LVSTTPPTLSILQFSLPTAIKRDNSLHKTNKIAGRHIQ